MMSAVSACGVWVGLWVLLAGYGLIWCGIAF